MSTDADLKAIELVEKFYFKFRQTGKSFKEAAGAHKHKKSLSFLRAVGAALIAVDAIIDLLEGALIEWHILNTEDEILDYWLEVKEKIKSL